MNKPVGRPEKTDSDGNRIITKVINVNVPVKLVEFLKDEGINRSELFTTVATWLKEKEICNKCYGKLTHDIMGSYCLDCTNEYYRRTHESKFIYKKFNTCAECQEPYSHENHSRLTKQGLFGCQECQESKQARIDINEFTSEKNDAI